MNVKICRYSCCVWLFLFVHISLATAQDSTIQDSTYSIFEQHDEASVLTIHKFQLELFIQFLNDSTQSQRHQRISKLSIQNYPYDTLQPNIRLLNKLTRLNFLEFFAPTAAYFPDSLWQFDSLASFRIIYADTPFVIYGTTVQSPQLKTLVLYTARPSYNRHIPIQVWDSITILKPEAFANIERFSCQGCNIDALWDWLKDAPNLRILEFTDAYVTKWRSRENEFKNLDELHLYYSIVCPIRKFDFRAKNLQLLRISMLELLPRKLLKTQVNTLSLKDIYIKGSVGKHITKHIQRKAPHISNVFTF